MQETLTALVNAILAEIDKTKEIEGYAIVLLARGPDDAGAVEMLSGPKIVLHGALKKLERECIRQIDGDEKSPIIDSSSVIRPFAKG